MKQRVLIVTSVVLLSAVVGANQQASPTEAVLIRGEDNVLSVSTVLARPGDTVSVSDGEVTVNGKQIGVQVEASGVWGPRRVEVGTYFVAGDPARLGSNARAWGFVPQGHVVGTVRIGELPVR